MTSSGPRLVLLLATLATLGGCTVVPAYDYGPEPVPAVVYTAPPAPLVEYRGLPPASGHVWIDGYWNWGGVRYVWVPGRWVSPPPGQAWVPRVWQRDGERWHSLGGHWERHREDRRPPPDWSRREFQPPQHQRPPESRRGPEPVPEFQRRPEGQQVRPGEPRPLPPAVRQEPVPRAAEADPHHRGPDDGRRPRRRWLEDGEPRERRPVQP